MWTETANLWQISVLTKDMFWTGMMWDAGAVHYIKYDASKNYKNAIEAIEDEDIHLQVLTGLYEKYK